MATVAQLKAVLTLNTAKFSRGVSRAAQSVRTMALEFKKTGRQMTRWITLPLAAVGTTAVASAAKTQDSFKEIKVAIGATRKEMAKIKEASRDIATSTGVAFRKIVDAQKLAQSSSLEVAEANELVRNTAKATEAGFGNMAETVNFATTTMLKFGDQLGGTEEVMDRTIATAQSVQLRVKEFIPAFQRALSPMKSLNISFEEGIAMFAGLADAAESVTKGGTQFRRLLKSLSSPGKDLRLIIEDLFGSMEGMKQAFGTDAFGAMKKLRKEMKKSDVTMQKLLGRQNAFFGMQNLMTEEMQRANTALHAQEGSQGRLQRVFKRSADALRQFNKTWAELSFAMTDIGLKMLPSVVAVLKDFKEFIKGVAKDFRSLSQAQQENILKWSGIAAAAGPVILIFGQLMLGISRGITLLHTFGKVIAWVTSTLWSLATAYWRIKALRFAVHIKNIAKAFAAAATATWGWAASLWASVAPMLPAVAAALLLAEAAILISQNWGKLSTFFEKWLDGIGKGFEMAASYYITIWSTIAEGIAGVFRWAFNQIKSWVKPLADTMTKIFIAALKQMNDAAASLMRTLAGAAGHVSGTLQKSLRAAGDEFQKNVNELRKLKREGDAGMFEALSAGNFLFEKPIERVVGKAKKKIGQIKNIAVKKASGLAEDIGNFTTKWMGEFWKTIKKSHADFLKDLQKQTQSFLKNSSFGKLFGEGATKDLGPTRDRLFPAARADDSAFGAGDGKGKTEMNMKLDMQGDAADRAWVKNEIRRATDPERIVELMKEQIVRGGGQPIDPSTVSGLKPGFARVSGGEARPVAGQAREADKQEDKPSGGSITISGPNMDTKTATID